MGVYKIFAEKDATVYSEYNKQNTGMDAILELTKAQSVIYGSNESTTSRILIKFSDNDINDVVDNIVNNSDFKAYLKLYLANASTLPTEYTLITYPLYESWEMGTGKAGNIPITTDGVSWKYRTASTGSSWSITSNQATSSYLVANPGGGSWYTASYATQEFSEYVKKDIVMDVTNIVKMYVSGSIPNNGFIIKNSGSIEFDTNFLYGLSYFSRDTNTIYPPVLEFRWDDSSNVTGSYIASSDMYLSISNNYVTFNEDAVHRFRLNAREQFPARTFVTSSIYTQHKLLPTASYYSIRDAKTNDIIVDFDDNYTKISSDSTGNYFDLYMNGLEPERYYRILIKTIVDGSKIILDDQYFFKIEE